MNQNQLTRGGWVFKRIVFALAVLGMAGSLHAFNYNNTHIKDPNEYVSQDIYIATHTAGVSTQVFVSSTGPVQVGYVTVNTAGSADAKVEIFDAQQTTTTANMIASINTSSTKSLEYHVNTSSGLCIYNQGGTPADVTVNWRIK